MGTAAAAKWLGRLHMLLANLPPRCSQHQVAGFSHWQPSRRSSTTSVRAHQSARSCAPDSAHTRAYIDLVRNMGRDQSRNVHLVGDESSFMPGGYDIAALAAGGAMAATEAVVTGAVRNAYALCRPPGHHATRRQGGGYCLFNNVAVAAYHAIEDHGLKRVAIVDYDVVSSARSALVWTWTQLS